MINFFKKQTNRKLFSFEGSKTSVYAIGDIHGKSQLLTELLRKIEFDIASYNSSTHEVFDTKVVFLGDYIDRGLESKSVVETLVNYAQSGRKTIFLKGNHEQVFLEFIKNPSIGAQWCKHGGTETLASYGVKKPNLTEDLNAWRICRDEVLCVLPKQHMFFFKELKSWYVSEPFMFVHAGIDPTKPLQSQSDDEFLWIRDKFLKDKDKLPFIIVHGHTPEPEPIWDGRRIGVDTGAYLSGKLSAVRLRNGQVSFLST